MTRTFPTVQRRRAGYATDEVDAFLDRAKRAYEGGSGSVDDLDDELTAVDIRRTAFPIHRGGYVPGAVDAAMERLEDAFAARERDAVVRREGDAAWFDRVRVRVGEIQGRLERTPGRRFARTGPLRRGYDRRDVDAFCDAIAEFFGTGQGLGPDDVRSVVFRTRRRGYVEHQVDRLLDEVVDVLLAVR